MGALGRLVPPDWQHVEKHPLQLIPGEARGAVLGINWYSGCDKPVKGTDGRYRVKVTGGIRGGHAICVAPQPADEQDAWPWHVFYDQGDTPACTGFSTSRVLTETYRRTYNPFWLYDDARRIDGSFPDGEGSYVRSAFAAAKKWAAHNEDGTVAKPVKWYLGAPGQYIAGYQWATDANQLRAALGYTAAVNELPLLNSWGTSYPETVYISLSDIQRLLNEEGEAGLPVLK